MKRTLWTPANIMTAVGYRFMRKAPTAYRCIGGSVVHPWLWCPRRVERLEMLCRKHGGSR